MVKLIKLVLEGFRAIDDKVIEFGSEINLITGPNEAGKSAILDAIPASIFKHDPRSYSSPLSWNNDQICKTYLTYETDDGKIFKLISNFTTGNRNLIKEDGKKILDKSEIDMLVKKHFGFDNRKVFENTVFVTQSQIAIMKDNGAKGDGVRNKIKDKIEEILVGRARSSATNAINKMYKKVRLSGGYVKKDLPEHQAELRRLENRLAVDVTNKTSISTNREKLKTVSEKLNDKLERLKILEKNFKLYEEKNKLLVERQTVDDENNSIREVISFIDSLKEGIREIDEKINKDFVAITKKEADEIIKLIGDINEINISLATHGCIDFGGQAKSDQERINKTIESVNREIENRNNIVAKIKEYKGFDSITKKEADEIIKLIGDINTNNIKLSEIGQNLKIKSVVTKINTKYLALFVIGILLSIVIIGIPLVIYSYKRLKTQKEEENDDQEKIENKKQLVESIRLLNEKLEKYTDGIDFQKDTFFERYGNYVRLLGEREHKSILIKQRIETELDGSEIVNDDTVNVQKIFGKSELLSKKYAERFEEISRLEGALSSNEKTLSDLTRGIKQFDKNTFAEMYRSYEISMDAINADYSRIVDATKNALCKEELSDDLEINIQKIKDMQEGQIKELAIYDERLKSYEDINFDKNYFEGLEDLRNDVGNMNEEKVRLEAGITTAIGLADNTEDLKDEIRIEKNHIQDINMRIEELDLAIQFLEMAQEEVYNRIIPIIEKSSKSILEKITNGRYLDIKMDKEFNDIKVKDPASDKYVDIDLLSQGTKDQIYFTLRVALSDALSDNVDVPLMLDDPFLNIGGERLIKTFRTLEQIGKKRQIILSSIRSYDKEIEDFSGKVILLNGPVDKSVETISSDEQYIPTVPRELVETNVC